MERGPNVWGSVHCTQQSHQCRRWLMVLKTMTWTCECEDFKTSTQLATVARNLPTAAVLLIFISQQVRRGPPVRPWREAFYNPKWAGEKDQITSEATPAAHKEVLRWTMELPWAPPLSPSWAAQPELNQSLGSEQPHGWTKCSQYNLIVIVLPSNVKSISFQNHKGMGL